MARVLSGSPPESLPLSAMKEQFSLGYVHMVVSAAGFSIKNHGTDYDGVDVTVFSSAEYETYYCPQFELQVKCTSQRSVVRQGGVAWRMEAGPFRKLTSKKRFIPAYLGVLVVPGDPEAWLEQDQEKLLTRSRMYWQAAPCSGRSTATRTARPCTCRSLTYLMSPSCAHHGVHGGRGWRVTMSASDTDYRDLAKACRPGRIAVSRRDRRLVTGDPASRRTGNLESSAPPLSPARAARRRPEEGSCFPWPPTSSTSGNTSGKPSPLWP